MGALERNQPSPGQENPAPLTQQVKLSVNIHPTAANALVELSQRRNTSMTEIVRDAIATELFVQDAHERGSRILIKKRSKWLKRTEWYEIIPPNDHS